MERFRHLWSKRFPPRSIPRLLLGVGLAPFIAFAGSVSRDAEGGLTVSWGDFGTLTLALVCLASLMWVLEGTRPLGSDDPAEDTRWVTSPPKRELSWSDLALSYLILVVGTMALLYAIRAPSFEATDMLLALGAAILLLGLVALSFSLTILLIIASGLSYLIATILHMFFYWLVGDESIWGYWAFSFVATVVMMLPMWAQFRSLGRNRGWARLPLTLTSSATCALLVLAAFTAGGSNEPPDPVPPSAAEVEAAAAREAQPAAIGAATSEQAARQLLSAWRMDYRAGALRVATPYAVDALFAQPFDPRLILQGCDDWVCRLSDGEREVIFDMLKENYLHHVAKVLIPSSEPAPEPSASEV